MASTARIAQGLKEDEEVEKTMLSETLNTASSTSPHGETDFPERTIQTQGPS